MTGPDFFDNLPDKTFLDDDGQINKTWKDYWKVRLRNPTTRREVRQEKAATRKRIHRTNRKKVKKWLDDLKADYSN